MRADSSLARYSEGGAIGISNVTILTGAVRIPGTGPPTAGLAPVVRVGMVEDTPPGGGSSNASITNVLVGAGYAVTSDVGLRGNLFFGLALPTGADGEARTKGPNARAQFDNALFAVNDVTLAPGVSAAWVKGGITIQTEATLFHLHRVGNAAAEPERTNFTCGLHLGFFVLPVLSVGYELRYQRWIEAPVAVDRDTSGASRDTTTVSVGPRLHFQLGPHTWFRPGIAYHRVLDAPLDAEDYHIVQIDLPLLFI